nr:putative reverse transcriptase domain, zinc finger, CCHC-type, retrotransposon Gag domain protein [Tanacetum cinerariifolium]
MDARINCRIGAMDIAFGNKKPSLNVFNFMNSLTMNECYQVDVIDEEVQKHAPCMLKDDLLELYLTDENEEILDIAEVQEIQECSARISPSLCMHRIVTYPDVKPSKDAQRRLDLNMKEVVKKEVLKWLDAGIIYPISDSKWVSPTQTVLKKAGITVVETESGEKPHHPNSNWVESVHRLPIEGFSQVGFEVGVHRVLGRRCRRDLEQDGVREFP